MEKNRIQLIDIARFYGIALVYYGHFIERIMYLKNPTAAIHYKFIYSFHMILFFVLAGFIAKERDLQFGFKKYITYRVFSRLIPFLFFTGFMILLTFFFSGEFFGLKLPSFDGYARGLLVTLFGLPMFNVPTWFLLCLFSVETVHYFAFTFPRVISLYFQGRIIGGSQGCHGIAHLVEITDGVHLGHLALQGLDQLFLRGPCAHADDDRVRIE